MKQKALKWLVCPGKAGARPCHGTLQVEQAMSDWDEDPQESLEAILRCDGCKRTFPVVCGIPILMDELPKYLRRNYYFIVGSCRAVGSLSDEMQAALLNYVLLDLETGEEVLFPTARRYTREAQLTIPPAIPTRSWKALRLATAMVARVWHWISAATWEA
jgi:uncharacterized protein YbaR (Trm112 family)